MSTLKGLLVKAVLRALAITLAFGGSFLAVSAFTPDATMEWADKPPAPGAPATLVEQHNCWTGAAPKDMEGKMPGHVVVTRKDGKTVYAGPKMVGKALEQVFEGTDHGLIVRGFCR